jgi:hypothetical protein
MADFATVAELETFMGTTGFGARGTAMLGYASAAIRLHCRQDLDATTGRQEEYAGEWNRYVIQVTQIPVTALTLTIAAVAFTEFFANYLTGDIWRDDGGPWDEGPILVTYDSGFPSLSDEMLGIKTICLEVAARALGGPSQDTFGIEVPELRGAAPVIFLTDGEKQKLERCLKVAVG